MIFGPNGGQLILEKTERADIDPRRFIVTGEEDVNEIFLLMGPPVSVGSSSGGGVSISITGVGQFLNDM